MFATFLKPQSVPAVTIATHLSKNGNLIPFLSVGGREVTNQSELEYYSNCSELWSVKNPEDVTSSSILTHVCAPFHLTATAVDLFYTLSYNL